MGTRVLLPVSREVDDLLAAICEGEEDQRLELEKIAQSQKKIKLDPGTRDKELAELKNLVTDGTTVDEDLKSLVAHLGSALDLSLSVSDISKFLVDSSESEEEEDEEEEEEDYLEYSTYEEEEEEEEPTQKRLSSKIASTSQPLRCSSSSVTSTPTSLPISSPSPSSLTSSSSSSSPAPSKATTTRILTRKNDSKDDILCLSELQSKARQISEGSVTSLGTGAGSSDSAPEEVDWGAYLNKLIEMGTNKLQTKNLRDSGDPRVPEVTLVSGNPQPSLDLSTELKSSSSSSSSHSSLASAGASAISSSEASRLVDPTKIAEVAKALPPRYSRAICAAIVSELEELHKAAATESNTSPTTPVSPRRPATQYPLSPSSSQPSEIESVSPGQKSEKPSHSKILRAKEEAEIQEIRRILPEAARFSRLSTMLSKATDEALESLARSLESGTGPKAKAVVTGEKTASERERALSEPTKPSEKARSPNAYPTCFSEASSLVNSVSSSSPISASSNTSTWFSDEDMSEECSSTTTSPFSSLTPRERETALTTRSLKNGPRPMNTLARRNRINEAVGVWAAANPEEASATSPSPYPSDATQSLKSNKHKTFLLSALASRHKKKDPSPSAPSTTSHSFSSKFRSRHSSMVQESSGGKGLLSDKDRKKAEKAEKAEKAAKKKAEKKGKKGSKVERKSDIPTINLVSSSSEKSNVTSPINTGNISPRPVVGPLPAIPSLLERKTQSGKGWMPRHV